MPCTLAVETLSLGDVTTSGKGAKTVPFSVNSGPADFTLPCLEIAFEPSAFQNEEATRVNLVMKVGSLHEAEMATIDQWILETYTPCLKKTEKWGSQFKTKLNLPGSPGGVRLWTADKQPRGAPEAWAGCLVEARVRFKHLYMMGAQWGAVIDATDLRLLSEPATECPF